MNCPNCNGVPCPLCKGMEPDNHLPLHCATCKGKGTIPALINIAQGPNHSTDIHIKVNGTEILINVPANSFAPVTFYADRGKEQEEVCDAGTIERPPSWWNVGEEE